MMSIRYFVSLLILSVALTGGAETIELANGARLSGSIVYSKADSVLVDLGFKVLEIPRNAIARVTKDELTPDAYNESSENLFRTAVGPEGMTVEDNLNRVSEAVVQVRTPIGLGSGFVIHEDGYIITNQHVVSGEHRITVTVYRQTEHELERLDYEEVRIVSTNPEADLALLKIENSDTGRFATVSLGESQTLRQGQTVFAVGSPLGLDRSVARGIVSLTDRVLSGSLYIQTTTAINPGNSGGPLFNLQGEVVGVNNLKLAGLGLEGLSFAIPIDTVRYFVNNRSAFAFDPRNSNSGFRYQVPPRTETGLKEGS